MSQFYTSFFIDFERELNDLLREHNNMISLAKRVISFIEEKIEQLNNWLRNHKFSTSELKNCYDNRVRSRLRQMFNWIAFDRKTKDKR